MSHIDTTKLVPRSAWKKREFCEVRGSKVVVPYDDLGHRDGATRVMEASPSAHWTHAWQGFVASGCDLLPSGFLRIFGVFGHSMSIHSREDPF
jgi:hypothetical protein